MITKLHVENYRMLRNTDLELGPLNILIGPNGSGKSTVVGLLGKLKKTENLHSASNRPLGSDPGTTPKIEVATLHGECLTLDSPKGRLLNNATPLDLAGPFGRKFSDGIRCYEFDSKKMRNAVPVSPTEDLAADGADLASFLDYIRDNNAERFDAIESSLSSATGTFDRIGFDRPSQGTKGFKLRLKGTQHFVPAAALSEGTVLLLALLALAHQPTPPSVLCIEEPERGIHPRLYPQVKEALLRLAFPKDFGDSREPVQVIATTHSPYLLDLFQDHPEFITVCERDEEKGARFRNLGSDPRAKEVLENAVLGEAWFTGALGGVPRGT